MKLNENTAELMSEIEFLIGSECYNPNSYDGYTMVEGREFRYPVVVTKTDENGNVLDYKVRGQLADNFYYCNGYYDTNDMKSGRYKFGSNHLYICLGIIKSLSLLEKRYGLNFEELEKKIKESAPNE